MYQRVGLGDDNSATAVLLANPNYVLANPQLNAASVSAACQWCVANPLLAAFAPSCWGVTDQTCISTSVPKAFVAGSVPVAPPPQLVIDSQTPDQTINDILTASQQNAVNAALAAAASQQEQPTVCTKGSSQYNALLCFWENNTQAIVITGLVIAAVFVAKGLR